MTEKVRVRSLAWALALVFVTSCGRTDIWSLRDPDGDAGEADTGGASGTGGNFGGGGAFGGSSSGAPAGGQLTGGDASGGASGGSGNPSGGISGTGGLDPRGLCPSLLPETTTLAMLTLDELYVVRADGSTARVNAAAGDDTWIANTNGYLFLAQHSPNGVTISLVDLVGNVLWSHAGPPDRVDPSQLWVNEGGDAVVAFTDEGRPGVVVLRSGEARNLPGTPRGPLDALGWVPFGDGDRWGFANVHTMQVRGASLPLLIPNHLPYVWRDRLIYLARDVSGPAVSVVTRDGERTFALGPVDVERTTLAPTDFGALVLEDGMPRKVLDAELLQLLDVVPLERDPSFEARFVTHGEWALVVQGQVPLYVLNVRSAVTWGLGTVPSANRGQGLQVLMNDRWAVGATEGGMPLFRVELGRNAVEPIDEVAFAPLRPLDWSCGGDMSVPALLDDGGIAVALRDDTGAAAYVRGPNEFLWEQLGHPVAWIVGFDIDRRSRAWILDTQSGNGTFCTRGSWPLIDELPEGTLHYDTVQVVLPDQTIAFEDHLKSEFVFHETGLCAAVRGVVHDFPTGKQTPLLPGVRQVLFF